MIGGLGELNTQSWLTKGFIHMQERPERAPAIYTSLADAEILHICRRDARGPGRVNATAGLTTAWTLWVFLKNNLLFFHYS